MIDISITKDRKHSNLFELVMVHCCCVEITIHRCDKIQLQKTFIDSAIKGAQDY